jgi:aldehyde dehydrogenase (NAD+)
MRPVIIGDVDADWPIASADLFAPVASLIVADDDARRAEIVNGCRFRLAASIFGDTAWATRLAGRLDVGHVSINDLIFPTSDPRVPFGGCGQSGFGVTRGEEGLLAMTRPKVIANHRGKGRLHLGDRKESDLKTLLGFLRWTHRG